MNLCHISIYIYRLSQSALVPLPDMFVVRGWM